ncbi:MAG: competence/damage-inducible protein A [Alphaproteobacteria bacterium]|nr:competence/damage-inducible protein A [Alphaproteobacteria bacterium]
MPEKTVTAAVLIIGNEVLSGRTQDSNVQYLAQGLNDLGVRLKEVRVVPDVEDDIVAAVNALRQRFDYLFTTGGIGPTHDDMTSACIAKAFGLALLRHPKAEVLLRDRYKPEDITEARLKMAETPEGASLIENPVSVAPGYRVENVFVLAGVPRIMQAMFDSLKGDLVGGAPVLSHSTDAYVPEGVVAGPLGELQKAFPDVDIGSYPFVRSERLGTCLVARSPDQSRLDVVADAIEALVRDLAGEPNKPKEAKDS